MRRNRNRNRNRKHKHKAYDVERIRREHPRAYEPWTLEEETRLREEQHRSNRELAAMFQRKPGAIRSKLKKMGLRPFVPQALQQTSSDTELPAARTDGEKALPYGPHTRVLFSLAIAGVALIAVFFIGRLTVRGSLTDRVRHSGNRAGNLGNKPSTVARPSAPSPAVREAEDILTFVTWNVRGYPESTQRSTDWFHDQLLSLGTDVLCIQEIANEDRLEQLCSTDKRLSRAVFSDSPSGTDNAIVCVDKVAVTQLPSPTGFQHSPQVAFVTCGGFDAVVVSIHLSWTDWSLRRREMELLHEFLAQALTIDPDVMLAGDFNLSPTEVATFAQDMGMEVITSPQQKRQGTTHAGNRYDYILLTPDLANEEFLAMHIETFAINERSIAQQVSDHLPVVAWFVANERFKDRLPESAE